LNAQVGVSLHADSKELHALPIALLGLVAPLPVHWAEEPSTRGGGWLFVNRLTRITTPEHPYALVLRRWALAFTRYCFTLKLLYGSQSSLYFPLARALPALLQYDCTSVAQDTTPPDPPTLYAIHSG